jgi:H+/Cl- antiporter ClcA
MFVVMLASSATIGALFGTPVAAALLLTGVVAAIRGRGSLWDKLYLPVAAAAAGSLTMHLLGSPPIAFSLPDIGPLTFFDLGAGVVIAAASAVLGVATAATLPYVHRAFHALRHPLVFTTLGGAVLGLLGVLGGPITLFKGLDQTGELLEHPDSYAASTLALIVVVKLLALLVAASAGFRGGRVFPIVFIGTAIGVFAHTVAPDVPLALAVACGAMGMVLVGVRDGWMALFLGVALTGDITLLPLLCVIVLPTWLIVSRAPALQVAKDQVHTKDILLGKASER